MKVYGIKSYKGYANPVKGGRARLSMFDLNQIYSSIMCSQVLNMHVLLIKLRLKIPHAHSLKDKRRQIKSLKDRLSSRFNASVAEIDMLDNWQQAVMGVCMVSNDKSYLDKQYSMVETLVLECTELEIIDMNREWL